MNKILLKYKTPESVNCHKFFCSGLGVSFLGEFMPESKGLPPLEELKKHFRYDPYTGYLYWIRKTSDKSRVKIGKKAGYVKKDNQYVKVGFKGCEYAAHRIAFYMYYGFIDNKKEIDHINGVRYDNRISNLRLVTSQKNARNMHISKNNKSNFNGVNWHKAAKKWQARIYHEGVRIDLGRYDKKEDAIKARKQAEIEYGYEKFHDYRNETKRIIKVRKKTNTGILNIDKRTSGKYRFVKKHNGVRYDRTYKTLEEAIKAKEEFYKKHGLELK